MSRVALLFTCASLGVIPLYLFRGRIKKAIGWMLSFDTPPQVRLRWIYNKGSHALGFKDDGSLYFPEPDEDVPWERHEMGTVNEYKFTSRSLQDSEFYLVDNSNKVCGKKQNLFFIKDACWYQCPIRGRSTAFHLQLRDDGFKVDPKDGKFFVIDLKTPEEMFKLGDDKLAKTNGIFMY